MRFDDLWKLVITVTVSQLAGITGSAFTAPQIAGWYATLVRPELSPPSWIFAPVWTTLFFLMGTAAFLVWRRGIVDGQVRMALAAFGIQLVLNTFWSIIFFGLQNPALALVEIFMLWAAIAATITLFYRVSHVAAYLMVPYILWVSFAVYLNLMFWMLN